MSETSRVGEDDGRGRRVAMVVAVVAVAVVATVLLRPRSSAPPEPVPSVPTVTSSTEDAPSSATPTPTPTTPTPTALPDELLDDLVPDGAIDVDNRGNEDGAVVVTLGVAGAHDDIVALMDRWISDDGWRFEERDVIDQRSRSRYGRDGVTLTVDAAAEGDVTRVALVATRD